MAAWSHRIVRDGDGKLHFAFVRFREMEDRLSGMTGIHNEGETIEDMRKLAAALVAACDAAVINLTDGRDPDAKDDDDEEE